MAARSVHDDGHPFGEGRHDCPRCGPTSPAEARARFVARLELHRDTEARLIARGVLKGPSSGAVSVPAPDETDLQ